MVNLNLCSASIMDGQYDLYPYMVLEADLIKQNSSTKFFSKTAFIAKGSLDNNCFVFVDGVRIVDVTVRILHFLVILILIYVNYMAGHGIWGKWIRDNGLGTCESGQEQGW